MKKFALNMFLLLAVVLTACSPSAAFTPKLGGTQWTLSSLNGQPAQPGGTINFDSNGQVNGSSGCNSYFGTYETSGDKLTFSEMGSTLMACMEPMMQQETDFFQMMSSVKSYSVEDDVLSLKDESGNTLAELKKFDTSLEGTKWIATGLNNGQEAVVSTDSTSKITLEFKDGSISGTGSCNLYGATYEVDGENITFGNITATEMACEEALMQQEREFFNALGNTATFTITPGSLEFRSADGAMQVSFIPAQ
jgi:heat shock protein HslJ